ncbi:DDE-type integrase/transposase/recombinase [Paraglaciecola sp. 25GB23A]|uniref:DDE-type integrase/transposase/recombinase n=1 Tax=Paraglaciecola sp. 25GB23A TaxID=3156068 RepID=UPI0032AF2412
MCDIEELLAERGITVSVETVSILCDKFGQRYCSKIRKNRGRLGDTWYLDEVFIKINCVLHYLWRAVDQDGDELDILVLKRRNKKAAMKFFRKLLKGQQGTVNLTAKLYSAARLISQRDKSMTEISYELNFSSPSHFISQFKKQFAVTPIKYRSEIQQKV